MVAVFANLVTLNCLDTSVAEGEAATPLAEETPPVNCHRSARPITIDLCEEEVLPLHTVASRSLGC